MDEKEGAATERDNRKLAHRYARTDRRTLERWQKIFETDNTNKWKAVAANA